MSDICRGHDEFETVEFMVEVDGTRAACYITLQALAVHFGATRSTAVATMLTRMSEIAAVARRVARDTPRGERVLVRERDFEASHPLHGGM